MSSNCSRQRARAAAPSVVPVVDRLLAPGRPGAAVSASVGDEAGDPGPDDVARRADIGGDHRAAGEPGLDRRRRRSPPSGSGSARRRRRAAPGAGRRRRRAGGPDRGRPPRRRPPRCAGAGRRPRRAGGRRGAGRRPARRARAPSRGRACRGRRRSVSSGSVAASGASVRAGREPLGCRWARGTGPGGGRWGSRAPGRARAGGPRSATVAAPAKVATTARAARSSMPTRSSPVEPVRPEAGVADRAVHERHAGAPGGEVDGREGVGAVGQDPAAGPGPPAQLAEVAEAGRAEGGHVEGGAATGAAQGDQLGSEPPAGQLVAEVRRGDLGAPTVVGGDDLEEGAGHGGSGSGRPRRGDGAGVDCHA